ncbi:MAG TPA: Holliday junction resolvase RecU [Blastocatellia bacterium]|nr:Holliday junction resolvase RecU [Blastocatellia bacterium]
MTRRGAETGSGFQEAINRTNEAYKKSGRAVITRKAVPGKFILERDQNRRGLALPSINFPSGSSQARLSSSSLRAAVSEHKLSDWRAFIPESKAEPDYGGAIAPDGRAIFFDAKTTRREALDFDNLHAHQVIFLEHMARVGAVAGFLVEFSKHHQVYFLPIQVLTIWRTESTRKSLPWHFFSQYLTPAPAGKGLLIYDYLTAIEEQERRYGRDFMRFSLTPAPARRRLPRKLAVG